MHYLSQISDEQTLVMYSGHPLGMFPSQPSAPRLVITNGMVRFILAHIYHTGTYNIIRISTLQLNIVMINSKISNLQYNATIVRNELKLDIFFNSQVIPNYSSRDQYEKMFALGVTM